MAHFNEHSFCSFCSRYLLETNIKQIKFYNMSASLRVQRKKKLEHPLAAYLIKPVQRITKYQLLLKDLQACCQEGQGEIKASDILWLNHGCWTAWITIGISFIPAVASLKTALGL